MKPSILRAAALLCSAVPTAALAQQQMPGYGPHMWNGGWWWHGWFFGPLMMILWIAAAVIVVVLLVRWLGGTRNGDAAAGPREKTPLDILKERFARGEIDKDEYEERRKLLE